MGGRGKASPHSSRALQRSVAIACPAQLVCPSMGGGMRVSATTQLTRELEVPTAVSAQSACQGTHTMIMSER